MRRLTIRYTAPQVATMVRIAAHGSIQQLSDATQTPAAELELIAGGRLAPDAGVLAYLGLQRNREEFVWQIR